MLQRTHGPRRRTTAFAAAAASVTAMTLASAAPAPAAPRTTPVYVWASDVNMRTCSSVSCPKLGDHIRITRMTVNAHCQERGDTVRDGPYVNDWWLKVEAGGPVGWISGVFVRGGNNWEPIPGVSQNWDDCHQF
ncbi:hypothetical protein [Streptomyces tsukubensis]|uniref:hypothetical protein n=1 Tax=Streptomyces tsukubensis TaxID=83656 RepID=UPI00344EB38B